LKPPAKLVVDANPIISGLLGGTALRVFWSPALKELATTEFIVNEVLSYLPRLAEKVSVPEEILRLTVELLPLTIYGEAFYRGCLTEAKKRIGERDSKDVDLLALALKLGHPVWSNDRDFEGTGVTLFTTANLLKQIRP
jgi:predicted nucleic acid-binding protein